MTIRRLMRRVRLSVDNETAPLDALSRRPEHCSTTAAGSGADISTTSIAAEAVLLFKSPFLAGGIAGSNPPEEASVRGYTASLSPSAHLSPQPQPQPLPLSTPQTRVAHPRRPLDRRVGICTGLGIAEDSRACCEN